MVFEIRFQAAIDIRICNGNYFGKCFLLKKEKCHDIFFQKLTSQNVGSFLELYANTDEDHPDNVQIAVSPEPQVRFGQAWARWKADSQPYNTINKYSNIFEY